MRDLLAKTFVLLLLASGLAPGVARAQEDAGSTARTERLRAFERLPESARREIEALTPEERRRVRRTLEDAPPERRRRFRRTLERFDELTPEQQQRFRDRLGEVLRVPPGELPRFERNRRAWRQKSPAERERMRERLRRFRALGPEQQVRLLERRFPELSEPEREAMLRRFREVAPSDAGLGSGLGP